jgi:hypothetical protein
MDRRPERRLRRLHLAAKIAARLNTGKGRQTKNALRLATEKPRPFLVPSGVPGQLKPEGYTRSVITALRRYGQATLWWHSKSRSFRVKVDPRPKGRPERRLLLDSFVKVGSGAVARCACGRYYARHDARQMYCSTTCADRERQRTRRSRLRARAPEARTAYVESEARQAAARQRRADQRAAAPYVADQVAAARDAQARREQTRLRNES